MEVEVERWWWWLASGDVEMLVMVNWHRDGVVGVVVVMVAVSW